MTLAQQVSFNGETTIILIPAFNESMVVGAVINEIKARFLFTPISLAFPWLLHRLIKQQKPDILHLHMPNVSVFWALLLPSARKPAG